MNSEQKKYKLLIKADLKIALEHFDDKDKATRLRAAYHMQQAVEKTIKLKAELEGLNLWEHDLDVLIKRCDDAGVDIGVPKLIREKADMITRWEAECRYYPVTVVRRDSIKKVYDITVLYHRVCDIAEDEYDLLSYKKAMQDYQSDPVTYTLDEVEYELGLK